MYEKTDRPKKNTIRSVANNFSKKISGGESRLHFVDKRHESIAQNKRQDIVHASPQVLSGVTQLRGFKTVNGKVPDSSDESTGAFVHSSLSAWDNIFKDDAIDRAGGVIAEYTPGEEELDAEALTKYEKNIKDDAFGLVKAEGSTETRIKRYEKQPVQTEMVMLAPPVFAEHRNAIQGIIENAIYGNVTGRAGKVPTDWRDNLDLLMEENQSISDYAQANEDADWLARAFTELLEQKVNQREGNIAPDALDYLNSGTAVFSTNVMAAIKQQLNLNIVTRDEFVGNDATLDTVAVLSHEFGHIKTALNVSEESIQNVKSGLGPNWNSVKMVISTLNKSAEPDKRTTHDRTFNTNLRFAWGQVLSEFYRSPQKVREDSELEKAIKILYNLLMSFEEYFNIEAVDNTISAGSDKKKRVSHGTERRTGLDLRIDMLEDMDKNLANHDRRLQPADMAKYVWISKLKSLIAKFIATFSDKFP
jgi:hypothetical protein